MAKKERRPLLAEDSLGSENEEEGPEGVAEEASEQVAIDLSGVDAETSAPSSSHPEDEQMQHSETECVAEGVVKGELPESSWKDDEQATVVVEVQPAWEGEQTATIRTPDGRQVRIALPSGVKAGEIFEARVSPWVRSSSQIRKVQLKHVCKGSTAAAIEMCVDLNWSINDLRDELRVLGFGDGGDMTLVHNGALLQSRSDVALHECLAHQATSALVIVIVTKQPRKPPVQRSESGTTLPQLDAADSENLCAVCLDPYVQPATAPCGHRFCRRCIIGVLQTNPPANCAPCPFCRRDVQLTELVDSNTNEPLVDPQLAEFVSLTSDERVVSFSQDDNNLYVPTQRERALQQTIVLCIVCLVIFLFRGTSYVRSVGCPILLLIILMLRREQIRLFRRRARDRSREQPLATLGRTGLLLSR